MNLQKQIPTSPWVFAFGPQLAFNCEVRGVAKRGQVLAGQLRTNNEYNLFQKQTPLFFSTSLYLLFNPSSSSWYTVPMKHIHTKTDLPIENRYPKLIRDRIPAIIERDGKIATTHIAEKEEYVRFLLLKLIEEATELSDAKGSDHQKEEIADVREVLDAIQVALGFPENELEKVRASKFAQRGGFADRIILDLTPEL